MTFRSRAKQFLAVSTDRVLNRTGHACVEVPEAAAALHASLFVADLHCDALLWHRDLLDRHSHGHVDLPRLVEGNVGLQVFTAVTQVPVAAAWHGSSGTADAVQALAFVQGWPRATWSSPLACALHQARRFHDAVDRSGGRLHAVRCLGDLDAFLERRKNDPGIVAGILGIEGLHCLEGHTANLDTLYDAGFRVMGLVHLADNDVCGSSRSRSGDGLTAFGRNVLDALLERPILLDLAHATPKTIDQALERVAGPVVVSHTGLQEIAGSARNISDKHAKHVADTGGVIGVGFFREACGGGQIEAVVRSTRHAVDVVGSEHVALGSDFDGSVRQPLNAARLPELTAALMAAGFHENEIRGIMGENVVRLLRTCLPR